MMKKENTVILSCTSLKHYVDEAQKNAGTDFPVVYLSRLYHRDPEEMKEHVIEALSEMPEEVDTVLVSMGFCGGSWDEVSFRGRLVLPRVDDCVSLLIQLTDEPVSNLKEPGHLYVREKDPTKESFRRIFDRMADAQDLDEETRARYHDDWKKYYSEIDIMDTGINGCRRPEYIEEVKRDADWLGAELGMVKGGTYLLEKMLKGIWDDQFLLLGPGERVKREEMLI